MDWRCRTETPAINEVNIRRGIERSSWPTPPARLGPPSSTTVDRTYSDRLDAGPGRRDHDYLARIDLTKRSRGLKLAQINDGRVRQVQNLVC